MRTEWSRYHANSHKLCFTGEKRVCFSSCWGSLSDPEIRNPFTQKSEIPSHSNLRRDAFMILIQFPLPHSNIPGNGNLLEKLSPSETRFEILGWKGRGWLWRIFAPLSINICSTISQIFKSGHRNLYRKFYPRLNVLRHCVSGIKHENWKLFKTRKFPACLNIAWVALFLFYEVNVRFWSSNHLTIAPKGKRLSCGCENTNNLLLTKQANGKGCVTFTFSSNWPENGGIIQYFSEFFRVFSEFSKVFSKFSVFFQIFSPNLSEDLFF